MKKLFLTVALCLVSGSAWATTARWTSEAYITGVQVADACGSVTGQYAVISDSAGNAYWITSAANNFNNVVEMAEKALINSRPVTFYAGPENYVTQTRVPGGGCWSGGTIANRIAIMSMR